MGITNTTWSPWTNTSCLVTDNITESRNLTEYDLNASTCYGVTGIASDQWNSGNNNTYEEETNYTCNYCSWGITNTTWSPWTNTSCSILNQINETRYLYEYDLNASTCYGVTGIASDLWNAGVNITYWEANNYTCEYDLAGGDGSVNTYGVMGTNIPKELPAVALFIIIAVATMIITKTTKLGQVKLDRKKVKRKWRCKIYKKYF